jgi:pyridoxal 5'-phosphate synthase pdxS subunit
MGGVARMSGIELIRGIMDAVTIPVMAKVRIGHFAEAQVLQSLGVDYIDESEVLTPADDKYHVAKDSFTTPFVCGARNLGEALRRIAEGAAMIRSKGEAGSGNIVEAVRHMRAIGDAIRELTLVPPEELVSRARDIGAPLELVRQVARDGKLPVVLFCAGGVSTPADASLMMQLGAEGIFVGSGIFKSGDPKKFARAVVDATTHYDDPKIVMEACRSLGESAAMAGLDVRALDESQLMSTRGN